MKLPKFKLDKPADIKASFKTRSFRVGGYSVAATIIVLAIAIAINVLAGALPASITQFDTTSNQLFSISDQTKKILSGLDEDVTVYWITREGYEDATLELMLDRYESLSSKVNVVKKDPDVYPTFLQQYELTSVYDNSLVVVSGEKYRYVDAYDIYTYEYDEETYYYTGEYTTSFAGEGAITSAINFVISEDLPKIYTLTGHGEGTLATTFSDAISDGNIETEDLSLLTVEAVPEDADAVMIYIPQSDISSEEKDKLLTYLQGGGNMLLITDPPESESLENLEALMDNYGVNTAEGIVVESNQNNYAWGTPYYLLPDINDHTITSPLQDGGYYVLLPVSQGLTVSDELPDSVSATELLTTSTSSFSKVAGYSLETYEKEDGDLDGPFALAVAITDTIDAETESQIVWISSGAVVDEQSDQMVSGGNQDFFLNCIHWMCEQTESISIHAKSMDYEYLTMDSGTGSMLTILMIGFLPLGYLGIGISIWIRRKRR